MGGGGGVVVPVVEDAPNGCGDGATEAVGAAAMGQHFVLVGVLLGGECIGDGGRGLDFGNGCREEVDACVIDEKGDIADAKGGTIRACAGVFAGTEEEIETNDDHICHRLSTGVGVGTIGVFQDMQEDGNGHWFYTGGRGVNFGERAELPLDAKVSGAGGIFANVFGPHAGELLAHRAQGVLHCARSDGFTAGGHSAIAIALGEDLEERDGVCEVAEERVDVLGSAEMIPPRPMVVKCGRAAGSNAGSDRFLNKAEVSAELMCLRR